MLKKPAMKPGYVKALLSGALLLILAPAAIAVPSSTPTPAPRGDLSVWEQKLLGKDFSQDPLDKRINRLELLLFGGTQEGSLSDRLSALRSTIGSRTIAHPSKNTATDAVSQLEQRVLKKTFAAEKVEVRLTRLETKLFGKASPSMSTTDRIDRLKRTIGIGEPPPIASSPEDMMNGMGMHMMPFSFGGTRVVPFGDSSGMPDDVTRQMNEMFKQLNDQLRALPRVSPHMTPQPGSGMPFRDMQPFQISPHRGDGDVSPFRITPPNGGDEPAPLNDQNSI